MAKSSADKVAAFKARRNEIGDLPAVRHRRLKERCRTNLALFGWYYCRDLLQHKPSKDLCETLIRDCQGCILHGGQIAELFGRGTGKTTWCTIIAPIWAALYGHSRFCMLIGASGEAISRALRTIKATMETSEGIMADFPAVAAAIRHIKGIPQRARNQTYHGQPTRMDWGSEGIILPMLCGEDGQPLDAGCGAIISSAGAGAAIRGANVGGVRPDLVILDDPQTRKTAQSATQTLGILEFIHQDALGLAGHEKSLSAFITITPQRVGDVAAQISDPSRYPNWSVKVQPFVKAFPKDWDQLVELFAEEYAKDVAAKDFRRPRSRKWYELNKAKFEGLEVIDDEQFDHEREVDFRHHVLVLRVSLGKRAFEAEYLMRVTEAATALEVSADQVAKNVNGSPRLVLPPGTDSVVGFCDVNIQQGAGLSWALVAFGPRRVAAVIAYGRVPGDGSPLVPPNASQTLTTRRVTTAIRGVVEMVAGLKLRDTRGHAVKIRAFGFDRGWLPEVVHRSLYVLRKTLPLGFSLCAMRGYPTDKFARSKKDVIRRGDGVFATRSQFGEYLATDVYRWRELQQSSWLAQPLTPGSLSIYGKDPVEHGRFAAEVVADKLVRKYPVYVGSETLQGYAWRSEGAEHWGDALTNCFALGSWFRCYDPAARTVDEVALGVKAVEDDTGEGTGAEPKAETDLETALADGKPTKAFSTFPRKLKPRPKLRLRRGRWRK